NRGEQIGGAGDHPARREVAAAIGGGDGIDVPIVERHAQRPEHAPESLTPRLVEVDAAGEYLDVHFLEVDDVMPLEGVEVGARGVDAVHLGQRGARRAMMVEERVVEVEENGAQSLPSPAIRAGSPLRAPALGARRAEVDLAPVL